MAVLLDRKAVAGATITETGAPGAVTTPPPPPAVTAPTAPTRPTVAPISEAVYNKIKAVVDELGCFDIDEIVKRTGYDKATVERYLQIMEKDTYLAKVRDEKGWYCSCVRLNKVLNMLRKLRGEKD